MQAQSSDLLSKYPGPVTLHASRIKWLALSLCAILIGVFGAIGLFSHKVPVILSALTLIIICIPAGLVVGYRVLSGRICITLDQSGFWIDKRVQYKWADVRNFRSSLSSKIFFEWNKNSETSVWRKAILPDTYGLTASNLIDLLEKWKERALASRQEV